MELHAKFSYRIDIDDAHFSLSKKSN